MQLAMVRCHFDPLSSHSAFIHLAVLMAKNVQSNPSLYSPETLGALYKERKREKEAQTS